MKNLYSDKYYKISLYSFILTFTIAFFTFSLHHNCFALGENHLFEGIKLYRSGDYDKALNELRNEVDINPHCPLAYYYAAKIRIEKEQFPQAKKNLEAALRDSSDFHDANGLLAYILLKNGQQTEAITAWKEFVLAVGAIEGDIPLTVNSITFPEEYHKKLRLEEERKDRERLEEKIDTELALSDENIETEPTTLPEQLMLGDNVDDSVAEIDTPMEDLEKRIRSNIRTGIYSIIFTSIIIAICVLSVIILIRKRRAKKEELTFSDEVGRFLIDNEIELNEDKAIKEFEAKKLEILQEIQSPEELTSPVVQPVIKEPTIEEIQQPPQEFTTSGNKINSPITEEVKALVSRLYREGHTTEDIARTADLTKTEVNLILAVREHHTNSLIEEINREEEDLPDRNQLIHIIHDLSAEGVNTRDIAKKLNISTSEVNLASMIIDKRKKI